MSGWPWKPLHFSSQRAQSLAGCRLRQQPVLADAPSTTDAVRRGAGGDGGGGGAIYSCTWGMRRRGLTGTTYVRMLVLDYVRLLHYDSATSSLACDRRVVASPETIDKGRVLLLVVVSSIVLAGKG